jgi:hypothetical protein
MKIWGNGYVPLHFLREVVETKEIAQLMKTQEISPFST